jgi:hypothetical protein
MKDLKTIKLKFNSNAANPYHTISAMTADETFELLRTHNIMLGEVIFTLYDMRILMSLITKSRFDSGKDIIYQRDLIKVLGKDGQLLK